MNLDIKDLGATLVIGAYFLLGLIFLSYLFSGRRFREFFHLVRGAEGIALTILTLSLSFGAGMLLEDISNKFVDSKTGTVLLPLDEELRAETLFGKSFLGHEPGAVPGPQACTAASRGLLAKYGPDPREGEPAQKAVLQKKPSATREQFNTAASNLYYHAKNTVYREDNYYDELKQIQTRIDFSRSFAVLSVILGVLAIFFGAVSVNQVRRREKNNNVRPSDLSISSLASRLASVLFLVTLFYLGGRYAYGSEEDEFNKRVYGYFFALMPSNAGTLAKTETAPCGFPIGYSGLARIDNWTFLVVHDTKSECPEPRLGTLLVRPGNTPFYAPIEINWGAELANDLEAVCGVPGKADEFLITESSYQDGKFGRIFHILLTKQEEKWTVTIKGKIALPKDTENVEGLACIANKGGGLTLLVGERGGSEKDPAGRIRWGPVDLVAHTPFGVVGEKPLIVPIMSAVEKSVRGCADLYVDDTRRLWSVATQDKGDDGPFRSVIYQAGTVDPDKAEPVQLLAQTSAAWTCDGIKVEGLGPSPLENSTLSVVTDDENYEGIWRPLFPSSEKK